MTSLASRSETLLHSFAAFGMPCFGLAEFMPHGAGPATGEIPGQRRYGHATEFLSKACAKSDGAVSLARAKGEGAASIDACPRAEPLYCSRERIIVIRGVHWNLKLRELHDALHGEPRVDDVVRFVLAEDALILSRSSDLPALRRGVWPGDIKGMA